MVPQFILFHNQHSLTFSTGGFCACWEASCSVASNSSVNGAANVSRTILISFQSSWDLNSWRYLLVREWAVRRTPLIWWKSPLLKWSTISLRSPSHLVGKSSRPEWNYINTWIKLCFYHTFLSTLGTGWYKPKPKPHSRAFQNCLVHMLKKIGESWDTNIQVWVCLGCARCIHAWSSIAYR